MEMPKPGPAQERLHVFVGEWRGTEKMHPTQWLPEGGMRDAVISNRLGLDGFAVIQDYTQFNGATPTFRGHAVIMKHPHGESYQMYWFDSFSPSVFEGDWDGVRGSFISKSPMGQTRASSSLMRGNPSR
jgi:hypothetical protein